MGPLWIRDRCIKRIPGREHLLPLREEFVTSLKGIKEVPERGEGNNSTACADWNNRSSCSHSILVEWSTSPWTVSPSSGSLTGTSSNPFYVCAFSIYHILQMNRSLLTDDIVTTVISSLNETTYVSFSISSQQYFISTTASSIGTFR